MANKYEIRVKGLEGRGLFALEDLKQGETVMGLPQVTQPLADRYSIEWPTGIHRDCSQGFAGAMNHCCSPNCAVRGGGIVAWRCVKAGEELTIDYKRTESKLAVPFDCMCGSRNCRGRIE